MFRKYGYSVEDMGEVRYKEMLDVEKALNLSGMKVLDLPDSGLKERDPREIESVIRMEIERIRPDVVVTYAVHGISGFHDHIVSHAVVKRVYVEIENAHRALDCYVTFRETIEKTGIKDHIGGNAAFEIYREDHAPPLLDLFKGLK